MEQVNFQGAIMLLAINDPAVQSALINAFAAVTSTVLAAASAAGVMPI